MKACVSTLTGEVRAVKVTGRKGEAPLILGSTLYLIWRCAAQCETDSLDWDHLQMAKSGDWSSFFFLLTCIFPFDLSHLVFHPSPLNSFYLDSLQPLYNLWPATLLRSSSFEINWLLKLQRLLDMKTHRYLTLRGLPSTHGSNLDDFDLTGRGEGRWKELDPSAPSQVQRLQMTGYCRVVYTPSLRRGISGKI